MFGCKCFSWIKITDMSPPESPSFSLPAPLPEWPPGTGFAGKRVNLGEIEVYHVDRFELIWGSNSSWNKEKGVSFYKPLGIPDGFSCLGHYCQLNDRPLRGFMLVAREVVECQSDRLPALQKPLDYTLVWGSDDGSEDDDDECGYFWLPKAREGYKPLGFLVTNTPTKPELDEVRVVRLDLTDACESHHLILSLDSELPGLSFRVWSTRPSHRGILARGVSVGTFFCSCDRIFSDDMCIACLKNFDSTLHAMPNLNQVHALINHYGPTVFFHADETFLPSSVSWFFQSGSLLYSAGDSVGAVIGADGSNLPSGGTNDGRHWIDLPRDDHKEHVKYGNLGTAKLYVHVKPALGGTFTDIVMWVFCPFNGPATLKVGVMNFSLSSIGQHVSDWEHYTLRISNFTGELWGVYFSQHSGGQWVDAYDLEFIEGNKAVVYSSRSGHASFPHPGCYLQGSTKLGVGIRNDCARSNLYVDSSINYDIVAAEYLGNGVINEPCWLQYMREWGPTIIYGSRNELNRIINLLPVRLRSPLESILHKLPVELYKEEGPTGPKEKNNWFGDERG